jgi:hypothetical protein
MSIRRARRIEGWRLWPGGQYPMARGSANGSGRTRIRLAMTVQRFRPDGERTRRSFGRTFMTIAVALTAGLTWLDIQSGRITGTAIVLFAVLAGLFALGYRLAFKIRDLFEIDVQERTCSVIREGSPAGSGPLDALGPLEVEERVREVGSKGKRRTIVHYVVHAAAHSAVDLYVEKTAGKARGRMEALAQAWRLPCRSLGGTVRGPDELNVPLHDRLREDREARTPAALRPEWGVRVEPLSLGYAMRSTHRSWTPLARSAVAVGTGVLIFTQVSSMGIVSSARHEEDLLARALLGLFGVVALVILWVVAQGVRDTFFPGTVLVTDRGVSYRFSRMPFREIEEITAHFPVEVVADRRSLALGNTFCPPAATGAVAHELQRLIIEVAETYPHARAAS